jgi:hypothetical protein
MPFNRLACPTLFSVLAYRTSIRMASTIVGKSGRVYVQGKVLQRHREDNNLSVFKAESVLEPRPSYSLAIYLTHST